MSNLSVFTLILIFAASCYVPGNSEETTGKNADDDFLQAINFANSPKNNQKPYLTIQEQQKQQQKQKEQQQQQQESQHHKHRQASKRSLLAREAATGTRKIRQKRSQHGLTPAEKYLRTSLPTYTHNLALLNAMNSLRRQLSNIELARLRSRLSHSAAADLRLYNDIYNHINNDNYNADSALLNVGASSSSSSSTNDNNNNINSGIGDVGFATGAVSLFDTDIGNGGLLGGVGNGDAGGVSIGAGNDMLANDIEDSPRSMPWQFVARVSKKSSALYKPRLGKRTRQEQQQQHEQVQQTSCN